MVGRELQAFGKAVQKLRLDQGYSQERLALTCGLDRTYISGIERGVRNPTLRTIYTIATALGITPSALLLVSENLSRDEAD